MLYKRREIGPSAFASSGFPFFKRSCSARGLACLWLVRTMAGSSQGYVLLEALSTVRTRVDVVKVFGILTRDVETV